MTQKKYLVTIVLLISATGLAKPITGRKGMVSSAHPSATQAGVTMLRLGGNAADAAAATAFALAVVEPYSSGIGGGGFALTSFQGEQEFFDFREVAPKLAQRDMYIRNGKPNNVLSRDGVLSIAVPGAVAGYLQLQKELGTLTRKQILAPAIELASNGFAVTPRYIRYVNKRLQLLRQDPELCRIFLVQDENGDFSAPEVGYILKQPDLAETLKSIAEQGAEVFYSGSIARKIATDIQNREGLITLDDLASYTLRKRKPLVGTYRGHAIVSSPPPSSGGQILLTLLNIMETLPPSTPWRSGEALHLYIEGSKRAFADRAFLGDPLFVPYVPKLIPLLVQKDRAKLVAQVITDNAEPATSIPAGQGSAMFPDIPVPKGGSQSDGKDTTHLSVIDKNGNAVALTTTINYSWGSGIVARETGIVLNDEMDDFAVAPGVPNAYGIVGSEANSVEPGKTPLSSMSPTIVFSGPTTQSPIQLVLGSPGGSRIPTTVAQIIINVIDHNTDIQRAITSGRIHHQHLPDLVFIEEQTLASPTIDYLRGKGHQVKVGGRWSNATGILVDPKSKLVTGCADPRGIGIAMAE